MFYGNYIEGGYIQIIMLKSTTKWINLLTFQGVNLKLSLHFVVLVTLSLIFILCYFWAG